MVKRGTTGLFTGLSCACFLRTFFFFFLPSLPLFFPSLEEEEEGKSGEERKRV